jgi:hypothetical protein
LSELDLFKCPFQRRTQQRFFASTLGDDHRGAVLNSIIYLETAHTHTHKTLSRVGDLSQFILRCLTLCSSYFFLAFIPFNCVINSFLSPPATHTHTPVREKAAWNCWQKGAGNSCCTNRITARLINGCPPASLLLLLSLLCFTD